MAPKNPKPVDKLTKPELLALVKRLHKRIERLEGQIAASMAMPSGVVPAPDDQEALVDANPAFPWEAK